MMALNLQDNWVERRAKRERMLAKEAPEAWSQVRSAIQDACNSYDQYYDSDDARLQCKLENGTRIRVTKIEAKRRAEVLVSYDNRSRNIDLTTEAGQMRFIITADDNGVSVIDSRHRNSLTPDEVSQRVLAPLLFPDDTEE
jgi:hypothetical protein